MAVQTKYLSCSFHIQAFIMLCLSRTVWLCSSAGYSLVSSAMVVLLVGRSLCVEPSDLSVGIYAGLYKSKSHSQKLNPTGNARVNSSREK